MRIGFDAKRVFHNRSGLGNYSRDTIRVLEKFYPANNYFLYNPKKGKINFDGGKNSKIVFPGSFIGKIFSSLWRRKWITHQLKQDGLDIFHGLSNELPSGIAQTGIVSVVTIHDLIFYKFPQWYRPADRVIHQQKSKQAAVDASHIIAISGQTKKDILEFLPVSSEKISVLYQGCHDAFKAQYNDAEKQLLIAKFNLPGQFILSVGTIEPRKNLLTTVHSLLHHNLPLVIVGKKTAYFNEIEKFIATHSLEKRVLHLAAVNMKELAMLYQLAFVFCYPSVYEGFGIPVIEALYSGTPVVTNKDGCFREAGGPGSFYIDCFDFKAMGDIIINLQNDEALYNDCIEKGRSYAAQFNDEVIAGNLVNLYKKLAGNHTFL
ncbi:MAG: glycosyltransferase family 4 protein [Rhizobacter sp.]|nr:glycosyltransferase family 4 protein [Ferruginibacter sp.]